MLVKIKGMSGFSSRLLIGMVLGVGMISTLEGQKAKQINEEYQREQNEQHKQFMENMNKSLSYVAYTKDSFDGTETSKTNMNKFYYTNVFGPNDNTSINKITDGDNNNAIIHSSPNTYKQNVANSADNTNFLETNLFGDDTVFYDEEAVKDELIQRSYKNMKEQAKQMYSDRIKENIYVWPDAITTYYTDMWGRDFEYTKTADNIAQLAFTPPWTGSQKLILPINLPEPAVDEIVENPYPMIGEYCTYISCYTNTMVLFENGDLWGIGQNYNGALGIGSTTPVDTWSKLTENVKSFGSSGFIIKKDDSLWSAGTNYDGELGTGNTQNVVTWTKVLDNIKQSIKIDLMMAGGYSVALGTDDQAWCTGYNYSGELGLGHKGTVLTWTQNLGDVYKFYQWDNNYGPKVTGIVNKSDELWELVGISFSKTMENVKDVYLGYIHKLLIKTNSELWGSGNNSAGQLGLGHTDSVSGWVKILDSVDELIPEVIGITIGGDLYIVKDNNWTKTIIDFDKVLVTDPSQSTKNFEFVSNTHGEVFAKGVNAYGQLGLGHSNEVTEFTKISLTDVKDISVTNQTSFALLKNGELWGSGFNSVGELGLGHSNMVTSWQKLSIDNVRSIHNATTFWDFGSGLITLPKALAVKNNGEIWAIGYSLVHNSPKIHADWYMVFDASGNPVAEP